MRPLLLVLGQLPQDPASGAARSMRIICEMMAARGVRVRALATTATEGDLPAAPLGFLRSLGCDVTVDRRGAIGKKGRPVYRFGHRGVDYAIMDVGRCRPPQWRADGAAALNTLFEKMLGSDDVVFTYGGFPDDVERRRIARTRGAVVAFGLHNMKYMERTAFAHVDAVLAPSEFVTRRYAEGIGLVSTAIPPPLDFEETIVESHEPHEFVYVNPSIAKGVMFFATLAERLATERPDLPLRVIEARGTRATLIGAGRTGGFDLARHASLRITPSVPMPRDMYTRAKAVIVPSIVEEAAGRVPIEAIVNGIPPIISDRGAISEICFGAGLVEPMPPEVTLQTSSPVPRAAVARWFDRIVALADDPRLYDAAVAGTAAAREHYLPEHMADRLCAFFESVRPTASVIRG